MASPVLLSPQEIVELRLMCAHPFLELGMTLRPKHLKCFTPHVVTKSLTLTIRFPTVEAARKWNLMHRNRILRGGHVATIALTAFVVAIGGTPVQAIATASVAAITKDEVQAKIWYPEMSKEWTLTREFKFKYQQFPRQHFQMEWTDVIRDEYGNVHEKRKQGAYQMKVGKPDGIPEELVHQIMTGPPSTITKTFE